MDRQLRAVLLEDVATFDRVYHQGEVYPVGGISQAGGRVFVKLATPDCVLAVTPVMIYLLATDQVARKARRQRDKKKHINNKKAKNV